MIQSHSLRTNAFICFSVLLFGPLLLTANCDAQSSRGKKSGSTIKGAVFLDAKASKSWTGDKLEIDLPEMEAKLRQYVILPPAPFPAGHEKWTLKQRTEWEKEFVATEEGKKIIERNKKLLEEANSFDIDIEQDGSFVIYDVPPGDYAIQGRVDKKVKEINYAFEVFGKLTVDKKVDLLDLAPIRIEVTPQYQRGQQAPPLGVATYNDEQKLELKMFAGKYLMLNFWSAESPVAAQEQKTLQDMHAKIGKEIGLSLLSINIDKDRKKALTLLQKNATIKGSHGFTLGIDHRALLNYGVRGVPSYWLIDQEGKILMNQYEFSRLMKVKPNFESIIRDRITNKDTPTLAQPEK
jgi:peroxiredoxin